MILDSNVVIALFQQDKPAMFERLAELRASQRVFVNLVIYAEVAPGLGSAQDLESALEHLGIEIAEITLEEAFRAGEAFAKYRSRGGRREAILADFLIGAQAETRGWPLVTRDRRGFASYFPELQIIDPMKPDE